MRKCLYCEKDLPAACTLKRKFCNDKCRYHWFIEHNPRVKLSDSEIWPSAKDEKPVSV